MDSPAAPVLFVPSERVQPGDEQAALVMRRLAGGEVVVAAYTGLVPLVTACGPQQPWVALPADVLDGLLDDLGAVAVVLDTAFEDPA